MKCVICKQGETRPGAATLTLSRDGTTLVIKGVPASVCANCVEEYVDGVMSNHQSLLRLWTILECRPV